MLLSTGEIAWSYEAILLLQAQEPEWIIRNVKKKNRRKLSKHNKLTIFSTVSKYPIRQIYKALMRFVKLSETCLEKGFQMMEDESLFDPSWSEREE